MTNVTTITLPNSEEIRQGHADLLVQARGVTVTDEMSHGLAQVLFKKLKGRVRVIEEKLDPLCALANATHKSATGLRAELLTPVKAALGEVSRIMGAYEDEERKKARKEAELLAAEEQKREEEEALDHAVNLEDVGDKEGAEEVISTPIPKPLVTIDPAVAKVKGVSGRRPWKAKIEGYPEKTDAFLKFVQYIAAHPDDIGLLKLDESALNKLSAAKKGKVNIPGVVTYQKTTHSARLG